MREKAEEALTEFKIFQDGMFGLLEALKIDSEEVDGGRCVRGNDGKLCFSNRERGKVRKDYMERIMNEGSDWDHNVEEDTEEDSMDCVCRDEVVHALNEIRTEITPGPSDVSLELIAASGKVGIQVMAELCQRILDGLGMPAEWSLIMVLLIFKRKCDTVDAMKLFEHGMKLVERPLGNRLRRIVNVDEMQFGFMSERETIDAVLIL